LHWHLLPSAWPAASTKSPLLMSSIAPDLIPPVPLRVSLSRGFSARRNNILTNCCADSSIYQSNGLCSDFCRSSYAFAVVQDDGCWCSNYVPGTTNTGCSEQCPGYPSELCGGNGVYGYIALGRNPSGTQGGSSAAPSSTTPTPTPSPSPSSTTAQVSTPQIP